MSQQKMEEERNVCFHSVPKEKVLVEFPVLVRVYPILRGREFHLLHRERKITENKNMFLPSVS
jgi:hypothetical protein